MDWQQAISEFYYVDCYIKYLIPFLSQIHKFPKMQIQYLQSISTIILFILIRYCAAEDEQFLNYCSRLFSCGETTRGIGYPFWGGNRPRECGLPGLELTCLHNRTTIHIGGQTFLVLKISSNNNNNNNNNLMITIARSDLLDDLCSNRYEDTWFNETTLFRHTPDVEKLYLFYDCPSFNISSSSASNSFTCNINGTGKLGYVVVDELLYSNAMGRCKLTITVPVLREALNEFRRNETDEIRRVLNQGFEVQYYYRMDNEDHGRSVREASSSSGTNCCPSPSPGNELNLGRKIFIGVGAAAVSAFIMCIIFCVYHHRYKTRYASSSLASRGYSSYPSLPKDLEKAGVHIFDCHELEEATDHFNPKRELGDGGCGAVYKGKLQDGRVVAVKRLYENHLKRVEQFMNEVEILTRLRHQNLVSLYGCTSCHSRELLLVYEYVRNGTLADHLHGQFAKPGSLLWITRLNIAIETASALAYLHASGVIHRDIKSTNILLDNNFVVKVADFGLSRLVPTDATHVSTAPQGTPGYVDPQYNEYYQLTEKSDVYSFGVVLIELISSKPAIDITRHRHEINLSTMAINKIQNHALYDLVDPHLGFESDYKVRMMIVAVAELAFQCLQNGREMRPHMQDVLNVLQEIQSKDYSTDVMDIPADYIQRWKSNSLSLSPNSILADC